jgi:hypothetical protein
MRLTALLLALVFQILPLQFWSGLVLCLHPDGRGFVASPDDKTCCQPCDASPEGMREAHSSWQAGHCEDIPLLTSALVVNDEVRGAPDARSDSGSASAVVDAGPTSGNGLLRRGLPCDGRDPPPAALSHLRSVVLRC